MRLKLKKPRIKHEHREQIAYVKWAQYARIGGFKLSPYLFAHPNGGSRHLFEAVNLKREGVKAGLPDLAIYVPRGKFHGLFLEMKRRDGGIVSKAQEEVIESLRGVGYRVEVCHGWEHAKQITEEYFNE